LSPPATALHPSYAKAKPLAAGSRNLHNVFLFQYVTCGRPRRCAWRIDYLIVTPKKLPFYASIAVSKKHQLLLLIGNDATTVCNDG
jgi:hypothetical protein